MNKTELRKTLIFVSLALLIVFPFLFYIKSRFEPITWWINSVWLPLPMLTIFEGICLFSIYWNIQRLKE